MPTGLDPAFHEFCAVDRLARAHDLNGPIIKAGTRYWSIYTPFAPPKPANDNEVRPCA